MLKKDFFFVLLFCLSISLFSQENVLPFLYELCNSAVKNNSDIKSAEKNYKNAIFSQNGSDGYYSPSLSITTSATIPNEYNWNESPDGFTTGITYLQPVISGTSIGVSGNYSYSISEFNDDRLILQNPQITFKLSQSLFPFWTQGFIKDPYRISKKKQTEYFYNQFLYTKQKILQELIQNYFSALLEYKKIQILKNSIILLQKQIEGLSEIKKMGGTNSSKIFELENSKWSYQQDLMSSELNLQSYLQNIKNLTEESFTEDVFFDESTYLFESDTLISLINNFLDFDFDPCEKSLLAKIEFEQVALVTSRQDSAPVLEMSMQPSWNFEQKKVAEWMDAWESLNSPKNWTIGLTVNLSPMFNAGFSKKNQKQKLILESAQDAYNSYIKQKAFVKSQYKNFISEYEKHYETVSKLIIDGKNQIRDMQIEFEKGLIAQLDFESKDIQIQNMILTSESLQLSICLYQLLLHLCL